MGINQSHRELHYAIAVAVRAATWNTFYKFSCAAAASASCISKLGFTRCVPECYNNKGPRISRAPEGMSSSDGNRCK